MKKIYLFLVLGLWLGEVRAQVGEVDTVNCNLTASFVQEYGDDAMRLSLRQIYTGTTNYTDSIIIPQSIYIPILKDLNAIRNTYSHAADSVFDIYNIHSFPNPNLAAFSLGLDTNQMWVKNWLAGNMLSGNDTVDAIMNKYSLIYGNPSFSSNICHCTYVNILTTYALNINALCNKFKEISGIKAAYGDGICCDGSDITMNDSAIFREYIFKYGTDDCQAGCIINHYWKFHVYPGCAVQYMGSWGTPLQHPTGITELPSATANFSLSPNPATSTVTITVDESLLGSTATVTDITGRVMNNYKLEMINTALQTESLANGVYLLTITSNNGISATKKLIISH